MVPNMVFGQQWFFIWWIYIYTSIYNWHLKKQVVKLKKTRKMRKKKLLLQRWRVPCHITFFCCTRYTFRCLLRWLACLCVYLTSHKHPKYVGTIGNFINLPFYTMSGLLYIINYNLKKETIQEIMKVYYLMSTTHWDHVEYSTFLGKDGKNLVMESF